MTIPVGSGTFIAAISFAAVGMTLGIQAIAPGLPILQRAMDLSNSQIGLVTTAYVLPGVLLTVPLGMLADVIGRRFLFCLSLGIAGVAAVIAGTTNSFELLLGMRALQGTCFASVMPLSIALLGDAFAGPERIRAFVGKNAILSGSNVVLPTAGAVLAGISWRVPVIVQAVTIPIAIYSFLIIRESRSDPVARRGYGRELLHMLRSQPRMFPILLLQFSRFAFRFMLLAYLPILLINERNASVTEVGLLISFAALSSVLMTTGVPRLIRAVAPSWAVAGGLLAIAAATVAFTLAPNSFWALGAVGLYGIGDGILAVLSDAYAMHSARSVVAAGMISVNFAARSLGKVSSPAAMAGIATVSSLQIAFLVMAVLGVLIAPVMLGLRKMDRELTRLPTPETEWASGRED